jgi:hypothetical protein
MNGIERTQHVLKPFQAAAATPDRRRKKGEGRPFELEPDRDAVEEAAPIETSVRPVLPSMGDEGVGEFVNIVV